MHDETLTQRFLRRIEVPIDADATYKNDHWTNRDLIPMPVERRTYAIWSYFIYWCISGMCISAYTTGSTLLAYGLTPQQAIGALVIGGFCTGLLSVACGWMGERHHIGFTVSSRFTWGMRGAYFPVIMCTFTWDGLQAYWGGQAMTVTLGAIITSMLPFYSANSQTYRLYRLSSYVKSFRHDFHCATHGDVHRDQTLAGGVLYTKDLIGMIIYYIFFITIMRIPPERLQRPFIVSSILFGGTLIGLLAWGVSNSHGSGTLFKEPGNPAHGSIGWSMMFAITSVLGAWGGGTLGQSDWTRYANRPCKPVTIIVTAIVGIVVTSCGDQILGEVIWQPFSLLARIQDFYGESPRARVGVFFAGLGCVCAQLGISIVLNSVSAGMDLALVSSPTYMKYLNIRRGAYYLSNASTFLTVLSGFGIFLAPFTGVMLADYLVVRRCVIKLEDCYVGDSTSLYWYWHGFHWRALVAWIIGVFPTMPGFIMSVRDATAYNSWIRIFNIAFFVGLAVSFAAFWLICTITPPPGVGVGLNYHDESRAFAVISGLLFEHRAI
ncbi:hypothetical protein BDZ89DRAFT_1081664 [Hymenopellis radicata]|nr:hypothetical protein BDZ89DRAFT_1081664 [Hymenopellis radicata]